MWHWDLDWTFTTPQSDGKGEFLEQDGNRMVRALMAYPDIRDMYYRRLRSLADEFLLPPGKYESEWDAIASTYISDWNTERSRWGGYTPTSARSSLLAGLTDRYAVIANNTGPGKKVPPPQSSAPGVEIQRIERDQGATTAEYIELVNPSSTESVDISGWTFEGVDLTIQPGTVLLPGAHVVFVANDADYRQAHPGAERLVGGEYVGSLAADSIHLVLRDGARAVDDLVVGPPPPPDTQAPSVPAGLSASGVTSSAATLSWTASSDDRGVAGYEVARDGVVVAAAVNGLSFTDAALTPSTTYSYTVRAFDAAGNRSALSAGVQVTTSAVSPVLFADDFAVANGSPWRSQWVSGTGGGGTVDVQGGRGRLAVSNTTGSYARAALAGVPAVADSDLVFSYAWNSSAPRAYFSVWSRSSGGWVNPYRPSNGYGLQLRPDSSTVSLQRVVNGSVTTLKNSAAHTVGTGRQWIRLQVTGSTVQYRIWADGTPEPTLWTATVTDTTVTTAGQTYLSSVRSSGSSEPKTLTIDDLTLNTGVVGPPPPPDTQAPSVPAGLSASGVTSSAATLSWTASSDDRGVAGYEVARDGVVVAAAVNGLSFTDAALTPSTTYSYTVRAFDAAGNRSAFSAGVQVTTSAVSPVLFADDFAVANGSPWRSQWVSGTGGGGTVDVQGGRGRLAVSNTTGSYARAALAGVPAVADSDLVFSYAWNSSAPRAYFSVWSRSSGGWVNPYRPSNGYGLQLRPDSSTVSLQRVVNGSVTTLKNSAAHTVGTGRQWIRLQVTGSTVQYRIWADGTPEPTLWTATVTDTTVTTAGQTYLSSVRSSGSSEPKTLTIDDLTLNTG